MYKSGLWARLRNETREAHQSIDDAVGAFETRTQYQDFVLRSLRFRQIVEPACADLVFWSPQSLTDALAQDLHDLGVEAKNHHRPALTLNSSAEKIGALYVLEGSCLGAKLLLRRAQALGFSERFGARHLALQTDEMGRWRRFMDVLESLPQSFERDAIAGAQLAFREAELIYCEGDRAAL